MLRLYNTLTRTIEDFTPLTDSIVTYYSCGPTVYDFAHLGHARTYIFADILERVLEWNGYKVKRVMNITDVGHLTSDSDTGEDKMEKGAKKEGRTVWEIAKFYTEDFFVMAEKLNIKKPEIITPATKYIKEMIDLIFILEKKGFTYTIADGVYFDTKKLPDYGKLTGKNRLEFEKGLKGGARVELVSGKKNITDFALWKLTPAGMIRQMEWDAPWGVGFPGWHVECSAMSMKVLGETLDIHTGGVDHIPIHHTNEIAQSEAATGKPFVRFWLHGEHLLVDGEKMSKSLGNFFRVKNIEEKGFSPLALRYLFLTASYRAQMNFTWKSLEGAQTALNNLYDIIRNLKAKGAKETNTLSSNAQKTGESFNTAVSSDLNMPQAVAIVWDVIKSDLRSEEKLHLLFSFDRVLGLGFDRVETIHRIIPDEIKILAKKREEARREKNFAKADLLRMQIEQKGYILRDSNGEAEIVPKEK